MGDQPIAWVTGAGGLIGNYVIQAAPRLAGEWQARGILRARFDLTDFAAVARAFQQDQPGLIIHCAGLTLSKDCQANPPAARLLNIEVTRHLTELAADIPMIFLSTDLVFDGRHGGYVESDAVNPLSVYGETKAEAERIVLRNPRHSVIRTSLNYGHSPSRNRSFNEEMLLAWRTGKTLTLFTDEFRCPIPAEVTARAVWSLARSPEFHHANRFPNRIFHIAGAERLSRWEIGALVLANHPQYQALVKPGSLRDYQGAPRPPDTSLNCDKAQSLLDFGLPRFGEWLATTGKLP